MRRIALLVAYDGSDFAGWQVQNNERTVQRELERGVSKVCDKEIRVTASGRTDSGVHASGQICHLDVEGTGPPGDKFFLALNRHLPGDVRVLKSGRVEDTFHARYNARRREYRYYIQRGRAASPFQRPYSYLRSSVASLERLNRYASVLVGTHDFSSFAAEKDENENKVRTVLSSAFYTEGPYTVFRIVGISFLWKMVRTIVGTILELSERDAEPEEIRRILYDKRRKSAGATAPARGLFLHRVEYDKRLFT
ncbi:MAG: tRNA pseudouridine(38-40) synthase TruA [Spirochaetia bacterium]